MAIDIVGDMLKNHTDEEIIAHLYKAISGIVKNYSVSVKLNQPEILWGTFGDLTLVADVLRNMKRRNDEQAAKRQSMVQ